MSTVKVYKENNFEELVEAVENAHLEGYELSSIKFDCHKDPSGKVLFWYAVVIFDEIKMACPQPPFPTFPPQPYPPQPYYIGPGRYDKMEITCDNSSSDIKAELPSGDMSVNDYLKIVERFGK